MGLCTLRYRFSTIAALFSARVRVPRARGRNPRGGRRAGSWGSDGTGTMVSLKGSSVSPNGTRTAALPFGSWVNFFGSSSETQCLQGSQNENPHMDHCPHTEYGSMLNKPDAIMSEFEAADFLEWPVEKASNGSKGSVERSTVALDLLKSDGTVTEVHTDGYKACRYGMSPCCIRHCHGADCSAATQTTTAPPP